MPNMGVYNSCDRRRLTRWISSAICINMKQWHIPGIIPPNFCPILRTRRPSRTSLSRYLIEQQRPINAITADLRFLIEVVARLPPAISHTVNKGELAAFLVRPALAIFRGEAVRKNST